MSTIPDIAQTVTNYLMTTYGNTVDWPTMVAGLNLSIFQVKLANAGGLPAPGAPPSGATVVNGQQVPVVDAAGSAVPGSPGNAAVNGTTLNGIQLTV